MTDTHKEIDSLKAKSGYSGKPQQWQYGFDLACRELEKHSKQPQWISVEDALPDFNVPVFAGHIVNGGFIWWIFERYDDGDCWVWSRYEGDLESDAYADDYDITHWMPLPEPPTKECE